MPDASGFALLGNALGGNSEGEYEKGLALGANTQNALAQARARVDQNAANQQLGEAFAKLPGISPELSAAVQTTMRAGGKPEDVMTLMLKNQEFGARAKMGDPTVPFDQRNIAAQTLTNAPTVRFHEAGTGMVQDVFSNEQPTVTPIGESLINQHNASADKSNRSPATSDKPPAGYTWETDPATGERKLSFIKGGPADPDKAGPLGSREATFLQRIVTGAKLGLENLRNVMDLPSGASTGFAGIGASPGHSVFQATKDTLRNAMSSDEVQAYNTMLAGLSRNLATIETSGLLPSGQFTNSFDTLAFREGDSEATKLHKLAEMRQIIEFGMDVALNNPRVSADQKQYLSTIVSDVRNVVPFTHADITRLQHSNGETLSDVVQKHGLPKPTPHPPNAAAPSAAPTPAVPGAAPAPAMSLDAYLKSKGH